MPILRVEQINTCFKWQECLRAEKNSHRECQSWELKKQILFFQMTGMSLCRRQLSFNRLLGYSSLLTLQLERLSSHFYHFGRPTLHNSRITFFLLLLTLFLSFSLLTILLFTNSIFSFLILLSRRHVATLPTSRNYRFTSM